MAGGVLIVDDDAGFRRELSGMLEGYEVAEAAGGEQALAELSRPNNIEAVVLDLRMPGPDGIETLKKIRASEPDIGVIIFTGFGTKEAVVDALKNGADDYLEKPAGVDEIRAAIEKVIEARRRRSGVPPLGCSEDRVFRIRRFIEKNRTKKSTLADAACTVFLSPKYMSRYFKQETGQSFSDCRLDMKLKEAEKLLASGNSSISEISERLGYSRAETFSRIFRKKRGVSPSEYRKQKRAEGN